MVDRRIEIAYEVSRDTLDAQADALAQVRNRTVSLLGAAALFVSFAAGLGLINTDPQRGPTTPVWLSFALMCALLGVLGLVIYVLWPVAGYSRGVQAGHVLSQLDQDVSEDKMMREIAEALTISARENSLALGRKSRASIAIVILVTAAALLLLLATIVT